MVVFMLIYKHINSVEIVLIDVIAVVLQCMNIFVNFDSKHDLLLTSSYIKTTLHHHAWL